MNGQESCWGSTRNVLSEMIYYFSFGSSALKMAAIPSSQPEVCIPEIKSCSEKTVLVPQVKVPTGWTGGLQEDLHPASLHLAGVRSC